MISVILPTYNRAHLLRRSIPSVLSQTHEDLELIVVDDGSSDSTRKVVDEFIKEDNRVRYIRHQSNKNLPSTRNTGIRAAKGKLIAFLDDDDEWLRNKLTLQKEALQGLSKKWGGVCCRYKVINNNKSIIPKNSGLSGDLTLPILTQKARISFGSTALIRRKVFNTVGYFDERFMYHEDLDFLLRFFQRYKLAALDKASTLKHGYNSTSAENLAVMKKLLLDKHEDLISSLGREAASTIYAAHWSEVSKLYALQGKVNDSVKYLKKSISSKIVFDKQVILDRYFRIIIHNLKQIAQKFFSKKMDRLNHFIGK